MKCPQHLNKGKGMLIELLESRTLLSSNAPANLYAHPLIATSQWGDNWSLQLNRNGKFSFAGPYSYIEDSTGTFTYKKLGGNGASLDIVTLGYYHQTFALSFITKTTGSYTESEDSDAGILTSTGTFTFGANVTLPSDLTCSILVPPVGNPGKPGIAAVTITNAGSGKAKGNCAVALSLESQDGTVVTTLANTHVQVNLGPAISKVFKVHFKWPKSIPIGTYNVGSLIDAANTLNESDATNNSAISAEVQLA